MQINIDMKNKLLEDSKLISTTVDKIVSSIVAPLDQEINKVQELLRQDVYIQEELMIKCMLQLNSILYDVIDKVAAIDIRHEIATMKQKSDFALARKCSEGTVTDKDNEAWLATQDINVLKLIYKQAGAILKLKVDRAYELLLTIKKVLSYRIEQSTKVQE